MGDAIGSGIEFLSGFFGGGGGEEVAAAAAPSVAEAGVGAGGSGLTDLVGTGADLFGGSTGLQGTLASAGVPGGIEGALGTGGGTALSTATDFLGAQAASGFNPSALSSTFDALLPAGATLTSGTGSVPGISANGIFGSPAATPGVATIGPQTTAAVPGLNVTGPAGPAAATSTIAPSGAGPSDLTSSLVSGAPGPTSLNGGQLSGGGGAPGGGGSFLDNLVASAAKNALPAGIAAAGLGYNLLKGGGAGATSLPSGKALNTQASSLAASSPQLMQYLTSGTLPAGMQASLDKATQDAKTAAISNAARNGQPTDPSQNSTLASELANIDQQKSIIAAQLGQQLLTAGLSEAQLSASDYQTLLKADQDQQKQISDSIANFSKALGGFGGGINLKVA